MALSLNSFVSSDVFLPALFLFFLSNLAAFLDKTMYYRDKRLYVEKIISMFMFLICLTVLCFYMAYTLNFIEIRFVMENTYKILIQGMSKSFFTFNAVNMTVPTIICVAAVPVSSLLLFMISYLRHYSYTKTYLKKILKENVWFCIIFAFLSVCFGALGTYICYVKFCMKYEGFGTPQYLKYFVLFSVSFLIVSFMVIAKLKKPKEFLL